MEIVEGQGVMASFTSEIDFRQTIKKHPEGCLIERSDQKEIIKNYALYNNTENTNKLVTFLKEQKQRCLDKIINFEKTNDNQFIQRKISAVKEKIVQLNEHDVTDKSIVKFMTLSDLVLELEGE